MTLLRKLALCAMMACCFGALNAGAQSLENARSAYDTFVRMNNEGADKSNTFDVLYDCYNAYSALLQSEAPDSEAAKEAKARLRTVRPWLQSGAIHFSQLSANDPSLSSKAVQMARAFVDIPLMDRFRGEVFSRDDYYPTMVYFAASGVFNAGDYQAAIKYFREYLATGTTERRHEAYAYLAKSCMTVNNLNLAKVVLDEAVPLYPTDFNLLSMAINVSMDLRDYSTLQSNLTRALNIKPDDPTLLNIQGKLFEDTGNYQQAVITYTQLRDAFPQSLSVMQHLAINYYNLGVFYNNKSISEKDMDAVSQYVSQSRDYFEAAIPTIRDILGADPASVKYLRALAVAYQYTGQPEEMAATNRKITTLGGTPVSATAVPVLISFAGGDTPSEAAPSALTADNGDGESIFDMFDESGEIPAYSTFAKRYVEERLRTWQEKSTYESIDEYKMRVNEQTRDTKVQELLAAAEKDYIGRYTKNILISDIELRPYDAENEVFLARSHYGSLIIPVPRANNEAQIFESSWNGMQFKDPEFKIDGERLKLTALTFVSPMGKSYHYVDDEALNYSETKVSVSFDPIDYGKYGSSSKSRPRITQTEVHVGNSDVDMNIPETNIPNTKTFAVIIANENYTNVAEVPMARSDGRTFSTYCKKTLGLPESNVRYYENASYGTMINAMNDIRSIAAAYAGDIQIIFYYAGHGIPNETTRDAFLLPIDADGRSTEVCYPLSRLYGELGKLKARSVLVFLDACFSGAKRDGGMIASARGVALKAKKEAPQGNMIIFSAASDDETAFPYMEKGHGLFTYFLLKKLQETAGDVTLSELTDYVTSNVKQQSVVINRKSQTPVVSPAVTMTGSWKSMKLRPTQ